MGGKIDSTDDKAPCKVPFVYGKGMKQLCLVQYKILIPDFLSATWPSGQFRSVRGSRGAWQRAS
jgi:hypothetical protein